MKCSVVGFPRIGANRELKFLTEDYFMRKIADKELESGAAALRRAHIRLMAERSVDFIPSNDFSFYDAMLDTACLFHILPKRYLDLGLPELDTYFAMARGYQGRGKDVKALPMKKWFNTNYHYIVPEIEPDADIRLSGGKPFAEFQEALEMGVLTKPVLVGPYTLIRLTQGKPEAHAEAILSVYAQIIGRLGALNAKWLQLDEPALVMDMTAGDIALFTGLYQKLLAHKGDVKILLQTYFGDIRDVYREAVSLDFDGVGLDFVEGEKTLGLIEAQGFPKDKALFAGVVNGKNVWRNEYQKTLELLEKLSGLCGEVVAGTCCSLKHTPYTVAAEKGLEPEKKRHLAFAVEKLDELREIKRLCALPSYASDPAYLSNRELFRSPRCAPDAQVRARVESLGERDFTRLPALERRARIQREALKLPLLPTTTIGSFPQTGEVRENRSKWKKGEITAERYEQNVREKIAQCVRRQEETGIDVLVHGEFERNDMVEYFGENLSGFLFTKKAWVQSYGTRCVKPPIIWGDVRRARPITVKHIAYAQSLTQKPVKGMLTGPVTILNWSFPREDIPQSRIAYQIALAIRDEALDLEAAGIRIIQIDEAALKEKLPIRRAHWKEGYLNWAIPAFRLVHSGVKPETQIHTHMCYSEFSQIIADIDAMDADVISFEASRSGYTLLDALKKARFCTQAGPGVYDIHSPRIPGEEEIVRAIRGMLENIHPQKLWINPDCGLKTRREEEVWPSLIHLVAAAKCVRQDLGG